MNNRSDTLRYRLGDAAPPLVPFLYPRPAHKVMRLYDKSVIYWCSTPGSDLPKSVPWHMIPVRPRHQMQPRPGDVAPTYTAGGGRKRIDHEVCRSIDLSRIWCMGEGGGGGAVLLCVVQKCSARLGTRRILPLAAVTIRSAPSNLTNYHSSLGFRPSLPSPAPNTQRNNTLARVPRKHHATAGGAILPVPALRYRAKGHRQPPRRRSRGLDYRPLLPRRPGVHSLSQHHQPYPCVPRRNTLGLHRSSR